MFLLKCTTFTLILANALVQQEYADAEYVDLSQYGINADDFNGGSQADLDAKIQSINDMIMEGDGYTNLEEDFSATSLWDRHGVFIESFMKEYPIGGDIPQKDNIGIWKFYPGNCTGTRPYGSRLGDMVYGTIAVMDMVKKTEIYTSDVQWKVSGFEVGLPITHTLLGMYACPEERRISVLRNEDAESIGIPNIEEEGFLFVELLIKSVTENVAKDSDLVLDKLAEEVLMVMTEVFSETDIISDNDSIPYKVDYQSSLTRWLEEFNDIKGILQDLQVSEEKKRSEAYPESDVDMDSIVMNEPGEDNYMQRLLGAVQKVEKPARNLMNWVVGKTMGLTMQDEL